MSRGAATGARHVLFGILGIVLVVLVEESGRRVRLPDGLAMLATAIGIALVHRRWRDGVPSSRVVVGTMLIGLLAIGLGLRSLALELTLVLSSGLLVVATLALHRNGHDRATGLLLTVVVGLLCLTLVETALRIRASGSAPYYHDTHGRVFEPGADMWHNIPRSRQEHRILSRRGGLAFDVTYRIEGTGARRTVYQPDSAPDWCIFGGSFTFGIGAEDEETIVSRLQSRVPDRQLHNYGVVGFGVAEVYRLMQKRLGAHPDAELCLYLMIDDHVRRTACPDRLTASWGDGKPRYVLESGTPTYRGPATRSLSLRSMVNVNLLRRSHAYALLPISRWEFNPNDLALSGALIEAMVEIAEAHGSAFCVVLLPSAAARVAMGGDVVLSGETKGAQRYADLDEWMRKLTANGVSIIDLRPRFVERLDRRGEITADYFYIDSHPRPVYNELVADWILEAVSQRMISH